jgi:acetylornithine/succinyldiaminopimelate/putrescine aminotransferase
MLDMKVKVVFVKDRVTSVESEHTVDVGEGWGLFASIPVPGGNGGRQAQPKAGKFGTRVNDPARELETRLALVFVAQEEDEVVRLDPPPAAPEDETAQAIRAMNDSVASPFQFRRSPASPPSQPSERAAHSS